MLGCLCGQYKRTLHLARARKPSLFAGWVKTSLDSHLTLDDDTAIVVQELDSGRQVNFHKRYNFSN